MKSAPLGAEYGLKSVPLLSDVTPLSHSSISTLYIIHCMLQTIYHVLWARVMSLTNFFEIILQFTIWTRGVSADSFPMKMSMGVCTHFSHEHVQRSPLTVLPRKRPRASAHVFLLKNPKGVRAHFSFGNVKEMLRGIRKSMVLIKNTTLYFFNESPTPGARFAC